MSRETGVNGRTAPAGRHTGKHSVSCWRHKYGGG